MRPPAAAVSLVFAIGGLAVAEAQQPIRIGASLGKTGAHAGLGQAPERGDQLWQDGKKGIVWPGELAPGTPRFPTPPWGRW